jgi:flagellar biosynthetic protein FliR
VISFTEAQILAWVTPVLWPFLRVLALLQILPVLGQRNVPARLKVALAFMVAVCASGVAPPIEAVPLDSGLAMLLVVQQVLIGLTIGFAVRIVFAAVEFAGEVAGLQMGMNFAGFFDPVLASQSTAASRFFSSLIGLLFVVSNGHLRVIEAVVQSLVAFPVGSEPFAFLRAMAPQTWGAQVFSLGLWIAMPIIAVLMFVNLVLGIISRVAPQANIFALGFPVTLGAGLLTMMAMLPLMESPFRATLERMLSAFGGAS